jgi:hypothetical protein
VPVNISVVPVNGERRWTALYDKREAGTFDARSSLSLAEYEERFADNAEKGLSLAYVNSYRHGGDLTIVGIWYSAIAEPYVEHHLDPSEFDAVMKKQRKKQRYLRGVTGYQRDGAANFIGIWRGSAPKRPTVTRRPR